MVGTLVDWRWPNHDVTSGDRSAFNLILTIVGASGQRTMCTPDYWYDSARLIVDEPDGRRVIRLSEGDRSIVDPVLARLVKERVSLQVFGSRGANQCSPELIWATPSRARAVG
jgi:hypothetical protein